MAAAKSSAQKRRTKGGANKSLDRMLEAIRTHLRGKIIAEKEVILVKRKVELGQGEFVLVDARDPAAYAQAHIPGAINIPVDGIEAAQKTLPKDREIVTYCWDRT